MAMQDPIKLLKENKQYPTLADVYQQILLLRVEIGRVLKEEQTQWPTLVEYRKASKVLREKIEKPKMR